LTQAFIPDDPTAVPAAAAKVPLDVKISSAKMSPTSLSGLSMSEKNLAMRALVPSVIADAGQMVCSVL
jgi:hypothetical protein